MHWTGEKGNLRNSETDETMTKKLHILGNGDMAQMMPDSVRYEREEKLVVCNMPPFEVVRPYATCIVDFKMCFALEEGSIDLNGFHWVCGHAPEDVYGIAPSIRHEALHRTSENSIQQFLLMQAKATKVQQTSIADTSQLTMPPHGINPTRSTCMDSTRSLTTTCARTRTLS